MARFRSKPVEIEAVQLTPDLWSRLLAIGEALPHGVFVEGSLGPDCPNGMWFDGTRLKCRSRNGNVLAAEGDWVIQESDGSGCYPCKPDVFAAKYEAVD